MKLFRFEDLIRLIIYFDYYCDLCFFCTSKKYIWPTFWLKKHGRWRNLLNIMKQASNMYISIYKVDSIGCGILLHPK